MNGTRLDQQEIGQQSGRQRGKASPRDDEQGERGSCESDPERDGVEAAVGVRGLRSEGQQSVPERRMPQSDRKAAETDVGPARRGGSGQGVDLGEMSGIIQVGERASVQDRPTDRAGRCEKGQAPRRAMGCVSHGSVPSRAGGLLRRASRAS